MKRICPECKEKEVVVKMLSFSSRMHCAKCFAQFEYSGGSSFLLAMVVGMTPTLAILIGLWANSLLIFGFVLLASPFVIEYVFAKLCPLKLVGVRALRKKLRGKGL